VTARLLTFFGPIAVVLLAALFFDERDWLKPVWGICMVFFVGIIVGSIGGAEIHTDSLTLRSFAISRLRIPYDSIQSIAVGNRDGGVAVVHITFVEGTSESPTRKDQYLRLSDTEAPHFATEIRRRAGLGQATSR
jgi:hypothetical protein